MTVLDSLLMFLGQRGVFEFGIKFSIPAFVATIIFYSFTQNKRFSVFLGILCGGISWTILTLLNFS